MESENLKKYREMNAELLKLRERFGEDSKEVDEHLDKMDTVWWSMTKEECDIINGVKS